MAVSILYFETH